MPRREFEGFLATFRAGFPDFHNRTVELFAEGETVCERFTITGTHRGEFMGIPPTGRRVEFPGALFARIRDGRVDEVRTLPT
jgi:predicted ester cyclase